MEHANLPSKPSMLFWRLIPRIFGKSDETTHL
ncbi:hypothetical protein ANAEL_05119 [Anaerolineales bacterium]|nr:hypothetical protein ANAEL_05119 [Anaerolineales bacterium]